LFVICKFLKNYKFKDIYYKITIILYIRNIYFCQNVISKKKNMFSATHKTKLLV